MSRTLLEQWEETANTSPALQEILRVGAGGQSGLMLLCYNATRPDATEWDKTAFDVAIEKVEK